MLLNFALPDRDRFPTNAILALKIQSLGTGENTEGNAIFTEQTIKIEAYLKIDKDAPPDLVPGADRTDIKVKGFAVNPQILPEQFRPGIEVECCLNIGSTCLEGFLEILPYVKNPLLQQLEIESLNRIKGIFRLGRKQYVAATF